MPVEALTRFKVYETGRIIVKLFNVQLVSENQACHGKREPSLPTLRGIS